MFYPAGVFFCILRLYTGQLKKLLEGLMTVSQLLPSGDPKRSQLNLICICKRKDVTVFQHFFQIVGTLSSGQLKFFTQPG